MKNYVKQFLIDFGYTKEDSDILNDAYAKIEACNEAKKLFDEAYELYVKDIKCDYYNEILGRAKKASKLIGVHNFTLELLVFICLTKHTKELYIERSIDLEIFHNSMLDLRYKLEECKAVYGICGAAVAWWFPGFFDLTRFALGRLQFEVVNLDHEYKKNGHNIEKGTKVINVHIPRTGTPMDVESCEKAYLMAKEFFKNEVSQEQTPFICHSWLLYPEHENILPKDRNVYRFFSKFDVFESDTNNGEDLWRLFDTEEKHPDRLPTDTSLRRIYVEHLKKGGRVGWGLGIFFI